MSTVCGYASITGISFGFIGNNGPIDPNGATKAAQFIQLCDAADMPILFFNNTTGYMVGTEYEQAGMIKHGSKMIQAVSNARVPKISLYIGASFGAGNYGMSGRAYRPRFLWSWPNSRISVMGGAQAAGVLATVKRDAIERAGGEWSAEEEAAFKQPTLEMFEHQSHPLYASARLWDDGVIDPRKSRETLFLSLSAALNAPIEETRFGVFRM